MPKKGLISPETNQEIIPETLRVNDYYTRNDAYFKDEHALKVEIANFCEGMEADEITAARLRSKNLTQAQIGRDLGLDQPKISTILKRPRVGILTEYFKHLQAFQEGPTDRWCEQILQRIAVDNERTDPKVAIAAIRSIRDIQGQGKGGPGGVNIVINGVDLKKGALDG